MSWPQSGLTTYRKMGWQHSVQIRTCRTLFRFELQFSVLLDTNEISLGLDFFVFGEFHGLLTWSSRSHIGAATIQKCILQLKYDTCTAHDHFPISFLSVRFVLRSLRVFVRFSCWWSSDGVTWAMPWVFAWMHNISADRCRAQPETSHLPLFIEFLPECGWYIFFVIKL